MQPWDISILPPTCWSFLDENANSFFATRWRFLSIKNTCFSGNAVHKAAPRSQTLFYQALQVRWDDNETNHRRLESRKGGVWKNESFLSCWASKVKINAYYKTMKVFFDLACMSTCCWGLPNPKYEPFITHNMGTLIFPPDICLGVKRSKPSESNSGPNEHNSHIWSKVLRQK